MAIDAARIHDVPLFAGLTDDQRAVIAGKLEERTIETGHRLTTENGPGYFFFVIESGTADVSRDDTGPIASLGTGNFFGEAAIFSTLRRTATVTANEPMVVFAMFGADFAVLVDQIPQLRVAIDAAIEERMR
jgi:CRP-like cAMP-binding protein